MGARKTHSVVAHDKTVIHNYGHGGSGMSLSWGTAHLAVDEALNTGETRYAVIGAGVVGLSTARLLQRRGFEVTVDTKDLPPRTTSNMSGAWFGPPPNYRQVERRSQRRLDRLSSALQ